MKKWLLFLLIFLLIPIQTLASTNQKIHDFAELLSADEVRELEAIANQYSNESQVDIVVITTRGTGGREIEIYIDDFYEERRLGYNPRHGDAVILAIDMQARDIMVASYSEARKYIDDYRAEIIRDEITPYLSEGNFFEAFKQFIELTNHYMGIEPEVQSSPTPTPSPGYSSDVNYNRNHQPAEDNIFFELWFQLLASVVVGGVTVGIMGYYSSGRKTTNARTYLDEGRSAVTASHDRFVRKTVTKTKKPSSNNKGGGGGFGGGGGGFTGGGGRSFSGSKGKF